MKPLIAIALTAAATVASLPASATTIGPFSGSWSTTDATQTGRIFRDGVASVAGSPKAFPGSFTPGTSYYYEVFQFTNLAGADAITVDATVSSTNTHFAAFSGWAYDTAFGDNGATYLGDIGSSLSQPFSFDVAALSQFMVVAMTTADGDSSGDFSFTVTGGNVALGQQGGVVPEPASLALLLAALGAAGAATRRSRQTRQQAA